MADDLYAAVLETALVTLAQQEDAAAFEELVRRRQGTIRGLLRHLSGDSVLADDLAQEAFFQTWRKLKQLRAPAMFGPWLRQIAVNLWLQHARRKQIPMEPIEEDTIVDSHAIPPDVRHLDLRTALDRLRPPERLCITLAYAEGMSHAEIAETTGLPLGTVKSHILRAAARLRAWIPSDSVKLSR